MKKRKDTAENYLEKIPCPRQDLKWEADPKTEKVTLFIENKGFYNRLAQKLFKRPKVSHIALDDLGSFVWKEMSAERNILELGKRVSLKFGQDAEPLYERLAMFFKTLDANDLIYWK